MPTAPIVRVATGRATGLGIFDLSVMLAEVIETSRIYGDVNDLTVRMEGGEVRTGDPLKRLTDPHPPAFLFWDDRDGPYLRRSGLSIR